jgi:hypothetical protein
MVNVNFDTDLRDHIAAMDKLIEEELGDAISTLEWVDPVVDWIMIEKDDSEAFIDLLSWVNSVKSKRIIIVDYDSLFLFFTTGQMIDAINSIKKRLTQAAHECIQREKEGIFKAAAKMYWQSLGHRKAKYGLVEPEKAPMGSPLHKEELAVFRSLDPIFKKEDEIDE